MGAAIVLFAHQPLRWVFLDKTALISGPSHAPLRFCCRPSPRPEIRSRWGNGASRPRYQSFVCCGLRQAGALQYFAEPSPPRQRVIWLREEDVVEPLYHFTTTSAEGISKCLKTNVFDLGPTLAVKQGLGLRELEGSLGEARKPGPRHVISAPELLRLLGRPPPRSRAPSKLSPRWVQP